MDGRRPAPSAQGAPSERWWTRNFRASASSSGKWGPASVWPAQGGAPDKAQSGLTRERAGRLLREAERARVGWGPGLAGEEEGEGADTAPSPPRPHPDRPDACYGAGLRRFMPRRLLSRPDCGSFLGDGAGGNPGGTRHLKAAAGTAPEAPAALALPVPRDPPFDQRRRSERRGRRSLLGGVRYDSASSWPEERMERGKETGLGWKTEMKSRNGLAICRMS